MAAHHLVADEDVLERATPGVMDAHRVVGRDRAVDETEERAALGQLLQLGEGVRLPPEVEDLVLQAHEVGPCRHRFHLHGEARSYFQGLGPAGHCRRMAGAV